MPDAIKLSGVNIDNTRITDANRDKSLNDDIKKILVDHGVKFGPGFESSDIMLQAMTNAYGAVMESRIVNEAGNPIDVVAAELIMDKSGWQLVPRDSSNNIIAATTSNYFVVYKPKTNLRVLEDNIKYKVIPGTENAVVVIGPDSKPIFMDNVVQVPAPGLAPDGGANFENIGLKVLDVDNVDQQTSTWDETNLQKYFAATFPGATDLTVTYDKATKNPKIGEYTLDPKGNEWVKMESSIKVGDQYEKVGDKFVYTNLETGTKYDVPIVVVGETAKITMPDGNVVEVPAASIRPLELTGREDILAVWGDDGKATHFFSTITQEMLPTLKINRNYNDEMKYTILESKNIENGQFMATELLNSDVSFPEGGRGKGIKLDDATNMKSTEAFFSIPNDIQTGGYYLFNGYAVRAIHLLNKNGSKSIIPAATTAPNSAWIKFVGEWERGEFKTNPKVRVPSLIVGSTDWDGFAEFYSPDLVNQLKNDEDYQTLIQEWASSGNMPEALQYRLNMEYIMRWEYARERMN
jgi:hypothetical protein